VYLRTTKIETLEGLQKMGCIWRRAKY